MCSFEGEILFCTCSHLSNENSTDKKDTNSKNTELYWQIIRVCYKDIDLFEMEHGRSVIPSESINDFLATDILHKLNNSHCFDFDYQAQDNDYLLITKRKPNLEDYSHSFPYLCFVFEKNVWTIDTFDEFNTVLTGIKNGRLK